MDTDTVITGLSRAEVVERRRTGQVNIVREGPSRTPAEIVRANVITRFNIILSVMLVVILIVAPIQDALFGLVMVINSTIGIVQELRARRKLDQLRVITAPKVEVIRDGKPWTVRVSGLVTDDVIVLRAGDQAPVDGVALSSTGMEFDESLLTGESEAVPKAAGDTIMSGSFVVAGSGLYRATAVGHQSYAVKLADQARQFVPVRSELRSGIDLVLKFVGWALVPAIGILLFSQLGGDEPIRSALRNAVAGTVAMVPQGLVLVTSVAFAVGVVRLARRQVLAQELAAVEGLARVDVICFDKTGTLTEGSLSVQGVESFDGSDVAVVLGAIAKADPSPNATSKALGAAFRDPGWAARRVVPFSSDRKWSAFEFRGEGAFVLGAPDVIPFDDPLIDVSIDAHAAAGRRVVMVAEVDELPAPTQLPRARPIGLVALGDRVRTDAPETLEFFARQGVAVKVISGDHTDTVRAIASTAGVPDADRAVDGRDLPEPGPVLASVMERANVFGRVSPHQKRAMVRALQSRGHVVAMTGDGVNDVLALKQADVGIAMGSGSNATRTVAELVLVDGQFSQLPEVVAEGRRVIANIERVANLYVSKTVYAFALVLAVGLAGLAFPFLPRHLTLVGSLTIGIPSFFLALERPSPRAQPGFVGRVMKFAVPTGIIAALSTFLAYGLAQSEGVPLVPSRTVATLVLLSVGLFVLAIGMRPLTPARSALLWSMAGLFALTVLTDSGRTFFELRLPRAVITLAAIGVVALTGALMYFALRASGWIRVVPEVVKETSERVRIADPGSGRTFLERAESIAQALWARSRRAKPDSVEGPGSSSDGR